MNPGVVVDVGNSRIKWGRCLDGRVTESVSLDPEDEQAWQDQFQCWQMRPRSNWALSGVHPARRDFFANWLHRQGQVILLIESWRQLRLDVRVDDPSKVGIDRLLNAVAASSRGRRGVPAILIDAGSAITVDWLDEVGAFSGGAILPGLRLMSKSLHDYTALLPLVGVADAEPEVPAKSTPRAIQTGVFWAAVGAVKALCDRLKSRASAPPDAYLTGGDGALLAATLGADLHLWPDMTLEGIRLAAEILP
jgi:type III pantothenate kinase